MKELRKNFNFALEIWVVSKSLTNFWCPKWSYQITVCNNLFMFLKISPKLPLDRKNGCFGHSYIKVGKHGVQLKNPQFIKLNFLIKESNEFLEIRFELQKLLKFIRFHISLKTREIKTLQSQLHRVERATILEH